MMIINIQGERRISMVAVSVSVLLHMMLFAHLINTSIDGQAQAPNYSTLISLNMLPLVEKSSQPVKKNIPAVQPGHKKNSASKPVLQPKSVAIPEQASAPELAKDVRRGQENSHEIARKHYLNDLLTYIEANKYYPGAARARGIKGTVEVSFELLGNGDINDLKAVGGSAILRKAAEQAVASSLPLPVPPVEVNCPIQVSYAMQFELN